MNPSIHSRRVSVTIDSGLLTDPSDGIKIRLSTGSNLIITSDGIGIDTIFSGRLDTAETTLSTLQTVVDGLGNSFTDHEAASDPHTGYVLETQLGASDGVATLTDGVLTESQRPPVTITTYSSGPVTLSAGASTSVSHPATEKPPVISAWSQPVAPEGWLALLHCTGTPFIDEMGNTVTNSGAEYAAVSTPVGTGAMQVYPEGDRVSFAPGSYTWQTSWTIEFFFKPTDISAQSGGRWILGRLTGSTVVLGLIMSSDGSGATSLYLSSNGSSWNIMSGTSFGTLALNTWYHVVLQHDGTYYSAWLNGTRTIHHNSSSSVYASTTPLVLANHPDVGVGDGKSEGYFTELAVRNTAVYSGATISVPSSRYSVSTSRNLLVHGTHFTASVNSDGDMTTIVNSSGSSLQATFEVRL